MPGMILGDKIYEVSILFFGDPSSPQAHFSIPWLLRIPQVYVPVSVFFWVIVGLLIQTIYNRSYSDGRGSKQIGYPCTSMSPVVGSLFNAFMSSY